MSARAAIENHRIDIVQNIRIIVGFATEHDPVDMAQVLEAGRHGFDTTVDDDFAIRKVPLQTIDPVVLQWRDFAILLWA